MDVVERLTLDAANDDTVLTCEHRHRYEFAARMCAGKRVLDLCCGSGYGSAILAAHAREVVGVDNDAATVELAGLIIGRHVQGVRFECADAVEFLRGDIVRRFDVIVCFEGLEHLRALDDALALLRRHAERGLRIVASVPNSKLFEERNPYHVADFGYDEATAVFESFPAMVMLPQFLAEGSLICPPDARGAEVGVLLADRNEIEYANHFLMCVNFTAGELENIHHGSIQVNTAPVFNRWAEGLKHALKALQRENARLAREQLGKAGSAAAAALTGIAERDRELAALRQEVEALRERCRSAEAQPREAVPVRAGAARAAGPARGDNAPTRRDRPRDVEGDPNSWQARRRRAAGYLIPWIEQTVPLEGKTVLEYGCGNAPVSCAFAERARRVVGVDIDADCIEDGRERILEEGAENIALEFHPAESILDAVAARRGHVDVFLLYAVLEHLTVGERLAALRLARDVVHPDGVIVVCEAPNRLVYFDHHTAQMPFFHLLPDELALDYYPWSPRDDFKQAIADAGAGGREAALDAIVRWGRGVSFHEFEVVFGDLSRHVIASNYDPAVFGERPVHPDEVILARYLERWRPDLAPVWSRYWLDLILSPRPVEKRPPFLRPWTADTTASTNVSWTSWETLRLLGAEAELAITLPNPTNRLVVGLVAPAEQVVLTLQPRDEIVPLAAVAKPTAEQAYVSFTLPRPSQCLTLGASAEIQIIFIGYEA